METASPHPPLAACSFSPLLPPAPPATPMLPPAPLHPTPCHPKAGILALSDTRTPCSLPLSGFCSPYLTLFYLVTLNWYNPRCGSQPAAPVLPGGLLMCRFSPPPLWLCLLNYRTGPLWDGTQNPTICVLFPKPETYQARPTLKAGHEYYRAGGLVLPLTLCHWTRCLTSLGFSFSSAN